MTGFRTQRQAAIANEITPQMEAAAQHEGCSPEQIMAGLKAGTISVPANRNHRNITGRAVGAGMKTKVNVNLGISRDCICMESEWEKARLAVTMQADAIMDLSAYGKTAPFRTRLIDEIPLPIGTVPVYDILGFTELPLEALKAEDFLEVLQRHAEDGVDFVTLHVGANRRMLDRIRRFPRTTQVVSRGGSLMMAWMDATGCENPYYEYYDRVLAICAAYDVTLSLGDAMRPGSLADGTDGCQISELIELGDLTLKAWEAGVQVIVEGPGHMALNEIAANMLIQKKLCHGAPFYVLGPLVTDVAPGYDHITSAIGGAVAASAGADFLCYVTPAEHLRLPDLADVREGIIASRIAAHAGDIAKGIPGSRDWDDAMSRARQRIDWEEMFSLALDPEKPRAYRASSQPAEEDTCTMCGDLCAMRTMNRLTAKGVSQGA